ncbi:hypothetical protein CSBG_03563 [Clostridium sp. 7_2_43FAA]|nr:hypothetical protein CSBG_03563 [Clostridium sp. 7_2_43FAA]
MSSNNKSNEIIDLLSEIIINHLSKPMSIDNTDKFKKQ